MKRIFTMALAALMALGMAAHPAAAAEPSYKWKIADIGSETHQYTIGAYKLNDLLQEKTDGRISLVVFPNSQLGAEREEVEGVVAGSIEMCIVTMDGALPAWVPDTAVMSIPYLFENKEACYDALDNYIAPRLEEAFDAQGLKCLGFIELGFRHITNNKKEIHSAADCSGLIIRVQESPVWYGFCNAIGASATAVAINELYTALQQGVVDGQENPLGTIVNQKFYEVQKNLTLDGHTYGAGAVLINKSLWESLSEADQQLLQECVDEMKTWQRAEVDSQEAGYLQTLKDAGMNIVEDPDLESFVAATTGIEEQSDIAAMFNDVTIVQGVRDYLAGK